MKTIGNVPAVVHETITVCSDGEYYSENITDAVQEIVERSGVIDGSAIVFLKHTTGALMLLEHEIGVLVDIEDTLEAVVRHKDEYLHHLRKVDNNGKAHVLNSMLNSSAAVPIQSGRLGLGEFQDIVFMDFQPRRVEREINVTVTGIGDG
mgnify:CR=1 FL=1